MGAVVNYYAPGAFAAGCTVNLGENARPTDARAGMDARASMGPTPHHRRHLPYGSRSPQGYY